MLPKHFKSFEFEFLKNKITRNCFILCDINKQKESFPFNKIKIYMQFFLHSNSRRSVRICRLRLDTGFFFGEFGREWLQTSDQFG